VPRSIPPDRYDALIRAATEVFLEQGYRRTQMADVAGALGVAKGTVYLYVESKEALFDRVLEHADRTDAIPSPRMLPVPTPRPGSTLRRLRARLAREGKLPALTAALPRRRARDSRAELAAIARELYRLLAAHRVAIKLLDRCGRDFPALSALWSASGRGGIVATLERYLRARVASRQLAPLTDSALSARMTLEVAAMWAVHRHWDPFPSARPFEEAQVEDGVVEFISRALHGDLP
jgi:AcrR family transcriptional regulator